MDQAERAYDALAGAYDSFTVDHDYEAWTATLHEVALRHGLRGRRLLDLACGTGKSLAPFLERGFEATGCDISGGMLAEARRKLGGRARLERADIRRLPDLGEFDLVTCLDDAVNYLLDDAELEGAFRSVARSLAPGGVFLFDVNTLGLYRSLFARDTCSEANGCFFALRGQGDPALPEGGVSAATIEAFRRERGGAWSRATSRHSQRHHADGSVRRALRAAGLRRLALHGVTPDGALHPRAAELRHTKRLYVAALPIHGNGKEVSDAPDQEARRADRPGRRVHEVELI